MDMTINDGMFISDRLRGVFEKCNFSGCTGTAGLWNREHVFAKSLANPSLETNFPGPGTDVHNLRAADSQKNTQRSNRLFIDDSGVDSRIINGDYFYPGDEWKGDVATYHYVYVFALPFAMRSHELCNRKCQLFHLMATCRMSYWNGMRKILFQL